MKVKFEKKGVDEQLRDIVADYRADGEEWPADTAQIADWAIRNRRWQPAPEAARKRLARMFARAMREERFADPQGRHARLKHVYPEIRVGPDGVEMQHLLWQDMPRLTPKQMHGAAQLRRGQILGDCAQLKTDLDSFNDNFNPEGAIQMSFDFTEDLAERELPGTYEGLGDDED